MFRYVQRCPLRRYVHTSTSRPVSSALRSRVGMALGASAAVTTYVAWKTLHGQSIALDSVSPSSSKPLPLAPETSSSLDATFSSHTTPSESGPSIPESTSAESPSTESLPALETPASEETGSEEEGAGGAFNPVTGEINWDCPCLGGMAHGPCGMQFREAFSCFVFSEKEPKGIDCVGKFKAMQDCFREHPEVYGDEILDDDEEEDIPTTYTDPVPGSEALEDPASVDPAITSTEGLNPTPESTPTQA